MNPQKARKIHTRRRQITIVSFARALISIVLSVTVLLFVACRIPPMPWRRSLGLSWCWCWCVVGSTWYIRSFIYYRNLQHALRSHFRWHFCTARIHTSAHGRWSPALCLSLHRWRSVICVRVIHSHISNIGHAKCNLDYYFRISTSLANPHTGRVQSSL